MGSPIWYVLHFGSILEREPTELGVVVSDPLEEDSTIKAGDYVAALRLPDQQGEQEFCLVPERNIFPDRAQAERALEARKVYAIHRLRVLVAYEEVRRPIEARHIDPEYIAKLGEEGCIVFVPPSLGRPIWSLITPTRFVFKTVAEAEAACSSLRDSVRAAPYLNLRFVDFEKVALEILSSKDGPQSRKELLQAIHRKTFEDRKKRMQLIQANRGDVRNLSVRTLQWSLTKIAFVMPSKIFMPHLMKLEKDGYVSPARTKDQIEISARGRMRLQSLAATR